MKRFRTILAQFINSILTVSLMVSMSLASTFISTVSRAEKEMTRTEFINLNVKKINEAKSVNEYIDSLTSISTNIRGEIKTWAKIRGAVQIPKASAHDPDIIIEADGKRTKITITDFKRGIVQINDKPFELNDKQTVSQNLDQVANLINNQKSVTISLFPRAEAFWQYVAAVIVIAGVLYHFAKIPDNRAEDLSQAAKDEGATEFNLNCDTGDGAGNHSTREVKFRRSGSDEVTTIRYIPGNSDPNDISKGTVEKYQGSEPVSDLDKKDLKLTSAALACCQTHLCPQKFDVLGKVKPLSRWPDNVPPSSDGRTD